MDFLALVLVHDVLLFLFVYKESLKNILNPISKEAFDSHYSRTSESLSCNDHYPVKASFGSRAAASGNPVVAFYERTVFTRD